MKYVCYKCGSQLRIDRDIDDDRYFDEIKERHDSIECPKVFINEEPLFRRKLVGVEEVSA